MVGTKFIIGTIFKLGAFGLLTGGAATPAYADDRMDRLTVGVVPQQSASRLAKIWVPILKQWSAASGYELAFATAKDIPTFEACLAAGAYDIAYMNPYHYTVFHETAGYQAFAKQEDKKLKGLIVTRVDADISSLSELEGAKIAFPSPAAFGASVIPRAELRNSGVSFEPKYVRSHDSVYRAVAAGLMPAGGGVLRTFNTVDPSIKAQLKVIYRTDGYTPHAFAAHSSLAPERVEAIFAAMASSGESGTVSLRPLGMSGIERATNEDWDDVRSLGLEKSHTEIIDDETVTCHSD